MGKNDGKFINAAIALARKADPRPNPRVGAVIVKNATVIGSGFHNKAGSAHAEIIALRKAGGKAFGATLYVTLEPCSHFGKTPPCTNAVIKSGISRVVFAQKDPTPKVNGVRELRKAGIKVRQINDAKLLGKARALNPFFEKLEKTGLPFVTLKAAMSLDGKIAARTGDSKWISSIKSRKLAHELRASNDAVLVGINTVLTDDPRLTTRLVAGRDPLRVVLDPRLEVPLNARILGDGNAVIAAIRGCSKEKKKKLLEKNVLVWEFSGKRIALKALLKKLARNNVCSVLVEGGGGANAGFIEENLVDEFVFIICPKLIGGKDALTPVEGMGVSKVRFAKQLVFEKIKRLGEDLVINAKPVKRAW